MRWGTSGVCEGADGVVVDHGWRQQPGDQDLRGRVYPRVYVVSGLGLPRVGVQDPRRPKVRRPVHEHGVNDGRPGCVSCGVSQKQGQGSWKTMVGRTR